jgi:hypothetical protein
MGVETNRVHCWFKKQRGWVGLLISSQSIEIKHLELNAARLLKLKCAFAKLTWINYMTCGVGTYNKKKYGVLTLSLSVTTKGVSSKVVELTEETDFP